MRLTAPLARLQPARANVVRHLERRIMPSQSLTRRRHLGRAQRRAMGGRRPLLVGRALADDRAAAHQRRPRIGDGSVQRRGDRGGIVPVALHHMPAARHIARRNILARRQIHRPVDGDLVIVPQHVQPPEPKMPGQPDRLVVDPFHQAPVASDHPGPMIDQIVAEHGVQMPLGDRHAHRHRKALPQRPGGALDPRQLEILRMPGARATQLAEALDVLDRRPRVTGQVQQRIDQHRSMPRGEHEPVAIRPMRVAGVELQIARPQHGRDIGHAHRHAGMARIGRLHSIHRKRADGVGEIGVGYGHDEPPGGARTGTTRASASRRMRGSLRASGHRVNRAGGRFRGNAVCTGD